MTMRSNRVIVITIIMIQLKNDAFNSSSSSSISSSSSGSSSNNNRLVGPSSSGFSNSYSSYSLGRWRKVCGYTINDSDAGGDAHDDDLIIDSTFKTDINKDGGTNTDSYCYSGGGGMTALAGETAVTTTMTLGAKVAT